MKKPTFLPQPGDGPGDDGRGDGGRGEGSRGLAPWVAVQETVEEVVDAAVAVEGMMASLAAVRAQLVDDALRLSGLAEQVSGEPRTRTHELAFRSLRAELATAMRMSERTAETLIATSEELVHGCPTALAALQEGRISYRHAEQIVSTVRDLPDDPGIRSEFERAAVEIGTRTNLPRFKRELRELRERMHPEPIEERHNEAAEDRWFRVDPAPDGMAYCTAYLPAVDAFAIEDRLTSIAKVVGDEEGEDRTRDQVLADLFRDHLIDPPVDEEARSRGFDVGRFRGIRPIVFVTVPALTLAGRDGGEPAVLEGYGPIDDGTARELTANAPGLLRVLTDPHTGARLDLGRESYRIPRDLRMWLRLRDATCRFPGCNRRAERCDLDHTVAWDASGASAHENLAHLCRGHHVLKHHSSWEMRQSGDGVIDWTSPLGRTYTTQPAHRMGALPHGGRRESDAAGPPPDAAGVGRGPAP